MNVLIVGAICAWLVFSTLIVLVITINASRLSRLDERTELMLKLLNCQCDACTEWRLMHNVMQHTEQQEFSTPKGDRYGDVPEPHNHDGGF